MAWKKKKSIAEHHGPDVPVGFSFDTLGDQYDQCRDAASEYPQFRVPVLPDAGVTIIEELQK